VNECFEQSLSFECSTQQLCCSNSKDSPEILVALIYPLYNVRTEL